MDKEEYKTRLNHRQRVRDKILSGKCENMSDVEILETLLFGVLSRVDTNPIARKLLAKFKTISGVFEASHAQLIAVDGVGDTAASFLMLMTEIFKRYRVSKLEVGETLDTWAKATKYLQPHLEYKKHEELHLVCLDCSYRVIKHIKLEEGIEDRVHIYNKKICRIAVDCGAVNVVLAHNHPTSTGQPSVCDDEMTYELFKSLESLDIRFIDHVIIGEQSIFSYYKNSKFDDLFAARGEDRYKKALAEYSKEFKY